MPDISLTDGATTVTVREAQDRRPRADQPLETMIDLETGRPVVYKSVRTLEALELSGRLQAKEEAERLEAWCTLECELCLIARDGEESFGWRLSTDPRPRIRRKDGDSLDWLADFKLWRL
jgi:hypothetical protein